jgi:hypothetical protein
VGLEIHQEGAPCPESQVQASKVAQNRSKFRQAKSNGTPKYSNQVDWSRTGAKPVQVTQNKVLNIKKLKINSCAELGPCTRIRQHGSVGTEPARNTLGSMASS